jgi:hypothetical protein
LQDVTHFEIAMACVAKGLHVLVTKPAVMTLEHHNLLHAEAQRMNVLVAVEVSESIRKLISQRVNQSVVHLFVYLSVCLCMMCSNSSSTL